jgi:hypothetical protein
MTQQAGNLSQAERVVSALLGLSVSVAAIRQKSMLGRVLGGWIGAGLLARSYAGHCEVKAVITDLRASRGRHSKRDEPPVNAQDKWVAARAAPAN